VGKGSFITVHDMKYDETESWPRVSLLQLAFNLSTGIEAASVFNDMINWPSRTFYPDDKPAVTYAGPNDLESVAGIPKSPNLALLCESGNSQKDNPVADRIYLADVALGEVDSNGDGAPDGGSVTIKDYTSYSTFTTANNVEASAVAKYDGGYLFVWGERDNNTIQWADLSLEPTLTIGKESMGSGSFNVSSFAPWSNRPIVGLDVDSDTGDIYLVSSYDAGSESSSEEVDGDNGPYTSATSIIGNVDPTTGTVKIYSKPTQVAYHDGFKVETVARAQSVQTDPFKTKSPATFIGSDDENYGGTIRKLKFGLGLTTRR